MLSVCTFYLVVILAIFPFSSCHIDDSESIPVLVISVDAFRWNFVDRVRKIREEKFSVRSRLLEMIQKGTFAPEGIKSTFSTTTYPNQHTLVTGLFQENHGVVSDVVYDPHLDRTADLAAHGLDDGWVFGGEPIWKTLEKHSDNGTLKSALVGCYMWSGCEYGGVNQFVPFKERTTWHPRIDQAIEWLRKGSRLVLVSSPELEDVARTDGPDSQAMNDALERFDEDIAYLLKELERNNLIDRVNVIIVSGHGVTSALSDQPITPQELPNFVVKSKTPTMWMVEPLEGELF